MFGWSRKFRVFLIVGLFVLATIVPATAEASEIFGTWRSSTGNVFEITGSRLGEFKLHVTYTNGAKTTLRGNWVPGLVGTQFQYFDGNTPLTGTFNPRDPDKVRVVTSETASWWQRDNGAPPVASSAKIFGVWRSSSGRLFEVNEAAGGGVGLLMTEASGRKLSLRGDWIKGLRGAQFEYWDSSRRYEGTFNAQDPDRVRVTSGEVVTFWTRNGVTTTTAAVAPPVVTTPQYICWQAGDPGCARTRDGRAPMDRDTFAAFVANVRAASPHVFPMVDRFRNGLSQGYLTSRQLALVLDSFRPHVFPMLDVVKAGAPKLVDPQFGAGVISEKFSPHTMVGNDAAAVVNAQHGDP